MDHGARPHAPARTALVLLVTSLVPVTGGCDVVHRITGPARGDVMATSTCPAPLRRALVAATPAPTGTARPDYVPDPPVDPAAQHPVSVSGAFTPDGPSQVAQPVTASIDPGYGASIDAVERCQVVDVRLEPGPGGSSAAFGVVAPGHLSVHTADGSGSLRLVDQPTYIREADDGSGAQDYGLFGGWYLLVEDPAPGTYRVHQRVRWSHPEDPEVARPAGGSSGRIVEGRLEVVLTLR